MSKCFTGFSGFDCQEEIWNGVFNSNVHGGSKRLQKRLSLPATLEGSKLTRKKSGEDPWKSNETESFLRLSESAERYNERWKKQWVTPPDCLAIFRKFIESVPEEVTNSEQMRFLPVAREVKDYLEKILLHCDPRPHDIDVWTAAGMYTLIAFFLQNDGNVVPTFYCPPHNYDPVHQETPEPIVVPEIVMLQPENIPANDTEENLEPIQEPVCSLHTACRICHSDELFYDDPVTRWRKRAYGFAYACRGLAVAMAVISCLMGFLHSILTEYYPSLAASVYGWIERAIPQFYAGFSDGSELILSICISGLFLSIALILLSAGLLKQAKIYNLLESERGYRWIEYECRTCSAKYKDKVLLRELFDHKDDDDEISLAALGVIQFVVIVLSACFLGSLFAEVLSPANFWFIPFLSLLLPVLFFKSLIGRKLLAHLQSAPHSGPVESFDEWLHELHVLYKYGEDETEDGVSEENESDTYAEE